MMAQMPICLYQANCAMRLNLDVYIVRGLLVGAGHYRSAHEYFAVCFHIQCIADGSDIRLAVEIRFHDEV